MIIKKYKAATEKEATVMAMEDLGPGAIVMNVKTIKPGGIMKLFKKTRVELTAAIDENAVEKKEEKQEPEKSYEFNKAFGNTDKKEYSEEAKNAIEERINNIAKLLEQQMNLNNDAARRSTEEQTAQDMQTKPRVEDVKEEPAKKEKSKLVELIYNQLVANEVRKDVAEAIIEEINEDDKGHTIDSMLAIVYQKIVLKLGQVETIKPVEKTAEDKKPKIIFFVGNTGVGKTTTMAKLASKCKLEKNLNIAMMSVDTYRIAAIEQVKTYANILSVPFEVIYTPEEMKKNIEKYHDCDLIFVDTAGRSHKSEEQKKDLFAITQCVEGYETEIYLVLSVAVKYSDLLNIADTYKELDYRLIFTKLDESESLGCILNLKMDTGKPLAYVTWGQNVPDDIGMLDPQVVAKKLLGGAG